jgi:hypothetical protein
VTGQEAGEVYDTVAHLSRALRVANAERDLYKEKYEEALASLREYNPKMAEIIDNTDHVTTG